MAGKANSKYRANEVIAAIPGTLGIKSAIAKKLGCDRHTVTRYIETFPTVEQAWLDERMKIIDMADQGLVKHLSREEWKAIAFVLTHLTDRGEFELPTQRQELEHSGKLTVVSWDDDNSLQD